MTDTVKLDELRALTEAATPGPWEPNEYGVGEFWVSSAQYDEAGEDVSVAVCILDSDIRYRVAGMDQQQTDMQFIAAARTAIPELLAELAAVTAERDKLVEALKLADAALSGANMNMKVVEKAVRAALPAPPKHQEAAAESAGGE